MQVPSEYRFLAFGGEGVRGSVREIIRGMEGGGSLWTCLSGQPLWTGGDSVFVRGLDLSVDSWIFLYPWRLWIERGPAAE